MAEEEETEVVNTKPESLEEVEVKVSPRESKPDTEGSLEWKDVNFTVKTKDGPKQILHDIKGRLPKGQLLGILGGSGAGKSTLLNILSGRLLTKSKQQTVAFPRATFHTRPRTSVHII